MMLPIVIVAALGLALVVRWWAVPLVTAGWGVLIAPLVDTRLRRRLALALVNALVGTALGVAIPRVVRASRSAPAVHD